tara:strand:+ start:996 stop:1109 length:114 start_codon:yes stop_codon:yes gene_type:complete
MHGKLNNRRIRVNKIIGELAEFLSFIIYSKKFLENIA